MESQSSYNEFKKSSSSFIMFLKNYLKSYSGQIAFVAISLAFFFTGCFFTRSDNDLILASKDFTSNFLQSVSKSNVSSLLSVFTPVCVTVITIFIAGYFPFSVPVYPFIPAFFGLFSGNILTSYYSNYSNANVLIGILGLAPVAATLLTAVSLVCYESFNSSLLIFSNLFVKSNFEETRLHFKYSLMRTLCYLIFVLLLSGLFSIIFKIIYYK